MPTEAEEKQFAEVMHSLSEFVRILVKEYPLVFKNGSGSIKVDPSMLEFFPYEVSLDIRRKG